MSVTHFVCKNVFLSIAQEYWWAVMLMGVAFVLFMGVFIKCCAVHTPSSNPKKPPALSITHTLRHPYSTLRRKRHHPHAQQPVPSAPYVPAPAGAPPRANPYSRPPGIELVRLRCAIIASASFAFQVARRADGATGPRRRPTLTQVKAVEPVLTK